MKKLALATALSVAATAGLAGNPEPVAVVEPEVVVQETTDTSTGFLVPLLVVLLVAAAVASD